MNKRKINEQSFFDACNNGELDKVNELLANGVDPLCKNEDGWTGFIYAAMNGHLDVSRPLKEKQPMITNSHIKGKEIFLGLWIMQ